MLAVAGFALALDGKSKSFEGWIVQQIITLLPTIFPIVFAAIMGGFFKAVAMYRAERGIRLGVSFYHPALSVMIFILN